MEPIKMDLTVNSAIFLSAGIKGLKAILFSAMSVGFSKFKCMNKASSVKGWPVAIIQSLFFQ
jgi:hypothetical protein